MRALRLRRLVVWSVLGVVLAVLALAMVIVWTANEREWYIDSAGISATLDMTLTDGGRWLATAVLGFLIALVLLAFAVELATANRSKAPGRTGPLIPSLEERGPVRQLRPVDEQPTQRIGPSRYASTIVGDKNARRGEQSLPPTDLAGIPSASEGHTPADESPAAESRAIDGSERDPDAPVRLRPAGRQ